MGYLICRTMRTYGSSYQSIMSMPIDAFWTVSGFVERIRADEAKLHLQVSASSQSGEAAEAMFVQLDEQAPCPVKLNGYALAQAGAKRDEAGVAELRMIAAG